MINLEDEFIKLEVRIGRMSNMAMYAVARNHKKALGEIRKIMSRLYEEHEDEGRLTYDEMAKYNRLKKLDNEISAIVDNLYKDSAKLIKEHLKAIIEDTSLHTIQTIEKATKRRLRAIVRAVDVGKTINDDMAGLKWPERMGKHRADVIWDIQKEIKQGLAQGDTYGTMSKRLKKELEVSQGKANVIIRTEGHRVHAQAKTESLDSIAKHGIKMTKKWVSGKDERVRSQHAEMNGVVVPYEEDFILPDGAKGPAPGLIGQPQHDINCRCIMTIDIAS